ncbi:MAG: hypothetical protein FIA96_04380 [Betaproteobacteria bacterium]|nr:hypothetical protein [Betaproteobacteria bacterium]
MALEKSGSLVDHASCQYKYDIRLGWSLWHVPELKVTALAIEARQRQLTHTLDGRTADALVADWKRLIDHLASEVGNKWFDDTKTDVALSLNDYRRFLESIDANPPAGLPDHWENSMANISIPQEAVIAAVREILSTLRRHER